MQRRVQKELALAKKSQVFKLHETENADGPYYISFTPKEGMYKNQLHLIKLEFSYQHCSVYNDEITSREFPKYPPRLIFITGIFHPNISESGVICVDVLADEWNPLYNLEAIVNSLLLLLEQPNVKSPLNCDAAKVFTTEKDKYLVDVRRYYMEKNRKLTSIPAISDTSNGIVNLAELVREHISVNF